ncbi:hypothetical protein FF1_013420 [Malus domestica]
MMVMASNSDKYAAVGRERYEELWLEDSVIWNHQGNIGLRLLVEKVIWTLSKATSGKDSGDEEDMFVDDMGRGSCSAGLYFKDGVRNIKHGQWHDGVDISKRNSQHANENGKGNEDDGVLESCCGKRGAPELMDM